MSDKVKLPKNVDEAIKSLSTKWAKRAYLQLKNYEHPVHDGAIILKEYFDLPSDEHGFEKLARALYIGYEVEKTPEEELLHIYESYANEGNDFDENVRTGIEIALRTLGIKIPGIRE